MNSGNYLNTVATDYNGAINSNILDFINEVHTGNRKYIKSIKIAKIGNAQAEAMQKLNGVDYTGYTVYLTADAVVHIDKRHGERGTADNTMKDYNNLARVGWVIENFDEVEMSYKKSYQFKNSNGTLADIFVFSKRINGFYYAATAVPNTSKKRIYIYSAYQNNHKIKQGI